MAILDKRIEIINKLAGALEEISRQVNAGELTPKEAEEWAMKMSVKYTNELIAISPAE